MPGSERWSVDLFFACGGLRGVFCKIAFVFAKPYAAGVFIPGHVKKVVRQRIKPQPSTKTGDGVIPCQIGKRPATVSQTGRCFALEPEKRLCPAFDPATIAEFRVAAPGEMGYRVLDNFCEEHIQ